MNIVVRYCSKTKFGNTRRIAEAIADGIGVKAVSIADEPKLQEKADILFLGGAPYANIDGKLEEAKEFGKKMSIDRRL